MTDDNIETITIIGKPIRPDIKLTDKEVPAIDPAGEFADLELELAAALVDIDQADLDFTAEVQKLDAAIAFLYSKIEDFTGSFTIADETTADTVALSLMRDANRVRAGAATAAELEVVAQGRAS